MQWINQRPLVCGWTVSGSTSSVSAASSWSSVLLDSPTNDFTGCGCCCCCISWWHTSNARPIVRTTCMADFYKRRHITTLALRFTCCYCCCCHDQRIRQCLSGEADDPKRGGIPPDSRSPEIHSLCQCCHRNDADVPLPTLNVNVNEKFI